MEFGCEVDTRTRSQMTPLMFAAKGGQLDIMQWLWDHGAQVNAIDIGGHKICAYCVS